jgi:hypothetical protein
LTKTASLPLSARRKDEAIPVSCHHIHDHNADRYTFLCTIQQLVSAWKLVEVGRSDGYQVSRLIKSVQSTRNTILMRPSTCGQMPLVQSTPSSSPASYPIACRLFNPANLHHFRMAFLATTNSCSSDDGSLASTGAVNSDSSSDALRSISVGSTIITGGLFQIALLFLLPGDTSILVLLADTSLLSLLKVCLVSVCSTTDPVRRRFSWTVPQCCPSAAPQCFQRPTVINDKKCCRSNIEMSIPFSTSITGLVCPPLDCVRRHV